MRVSAPISIASGCRIVSGMTLYRRFWMETIACLGNLDTENAGIAF